MQFVEKLAELQKLGEPAAQRFKSMEARADYFPEVEKTIAHYRALAESTEEKSAALCAFSGFVAALGNAFPCFITV